MNINIFYSNYIYQKKKYIENNYKAGSSSIQEQNEIFNQYDKFHNLNIENAKKYITNIYYSTNEKSDNNEQYEKQKQKIELINTYLLEKHFLPFIESLSDKNISQYLKEQLSNNINNYEIEKVIRNYLKNKDKNKEINEIEFIIDSYIQFIYWYICIYSAEPFKINYNTSKTFFTKKLELKKWIDLYESYDKEQYYLYFAPLISNIIYKYFEKDKTENFEIKEIHYFFDNEEDYVDVGKDSLEKIKVKIDSIEKEKKTIQKEDIYDLKILLCEYFKKIPTPNYEKYMSELKQNNTFNKKYMNENIKTEVFLESLERLDKKYFQYFYNDVIEKLLLLFLKKDDIQGGSRGSRGKYTGRSHMNERKKIFNEKYKILSKTLLTISNKLYLISDEDEKMESEFDEVLNNIKDQREIIFIETKKEYEIKESLLNINEIFNLEDEESTTKSDIFIPIVYVNNVFDYVENHVVVIHKILDNGEYKYYYFDPYEIEVENENNQILKLLTTNLYKNNILNYSDSFTKCNLLSQDHDMCTYISILYILLNYKNKDIIKDAKQRIKIVCSIIDNWIKGHFIIEFIVLLIKQFKENLNNDTFKFEDLFNILKKLDNKIKEINRPITDYNALNYLWEN